VTGEPKEYTFISYKALYDARSALSSGLLAMGRRPGENMGLYSINCTEWCLLEAAMTRISVVSAGPHLFILSAQLTSA